MQFRSLLLGVVVVVSACVAAAVSTVEGVVGNKDPYKHLGYFCAKVIVVIATTFLSYIQIVTYRNSTNINKRSNCRCLYNIYLY